MLLHTCIDNRIQLAEQQAGLSWTLASCSTCCTAHTYTHTHTTHTPPDTLTYTGCHTPWKPATTQQSPADNEHRNYKPIGMCCTAALTAPQQNVVGSEDGRLRQQPRPSERVTPNPHTIPEMPYLEVVSGAGSSGRCRSTQQLPRSPRQLKSARGLESSEHLQPWNTTHPTHLPHSRTTASREVSAHTWSQVGFVPLAAHRTQRAGRFCTPSGSQNTKSKLVGSESQCCR